MPKLLQINATANWGSTGRIAEQIGCVAIEAGWESYIAYGRNSTKSESKLIQIGSIWNTYIHVFFARLFDNAGLGSRQATRRLIDKIEDINPDIVHLHNIHGYYVNYKLLLEYLGRKGVQAVWTFHDCWAFTGHCAHFVNADCNKWMIQCHDCPLQYSYPKSLFADNSKRNYLLKRSLCSGLMLTVVAVSAWMNGLVKQSFLRDEQVEVIHNGVDLEVFKPSISVEHHGFNVIAVSNIWNEGKGFNDMLILRSLLDESIGITVIGLTPAQIKKLPRGIKGMQRTSSVQELVEAYSAADVLVNPTYADTFPTVNLEALACGTPVITYNTGGSPEAVDEQTGIVVEQGDVKALAEAVLKMKENPLSSHACRTRAEEHFDKDKCFKKYIELYETLLNKSK